MNDNKYIKGPFKADFHGGYVFSGPDNFMFAQVRGWGELGYQKEGEAIQDANLQFMVDALNEKASGALKRAGDEIADLAHPEFGEMGRLQEEIHDLKKEVARLQARESEAVMQAERDAKRADKNAAEVGKLRDWASKIIGDSGPDLDAYLDGHVEAPDLKELNKELAWLRFYKKEIYPCLGPADDEINTHIRRAYVTKVGLDGLHKKMRQEHEEYEEDHKGD